jgi:hypothetical protein
MPPALFRRSVGLNLDDAAWSPAISSRNWVCALAGLGSGENRPLEHGRLGPGYHRPPEAKRTRPRGARTGQEMLA